MWAKRKGQKFVCRCNLFLFRLVVCPNRYS
jgi:hypothetical protein